ncbi:Hypothetical protein GLP15_1384 [Giardia lamblia P15]|uniref:Uncharacterized protein n=1 Tax=Giardia intestinalis (strain P15) TaxID=658858 RepID=E1EZA3_GIAIA|nr:Hypothetical protein GLP15_1384 [Giardia lamblia P15]
MSADLPQHVLDALDKAEKYLCGIASTSVERTEGANTVFTVARGHAILLAGHTFGARMLEEALQVGTRDQISTIFTEIYPSIMAVMRSESGSHVCQTLLALVSRIYRDDQSSLSMESLGVISAINKADNNLAELYSTLVLQKIIPEIPDLITHKFTNHVLRTLLRVEGGSPPEDEDRGRRKHANESTFCTMYGPTDPFSGVCSNLFVPFSQALYKALQGKGTICQSCFDTYKSVLLQTYCRIIARCKESVDIPMVQQPLGVLLQLLSLPTTIIDKVTRKKLKDFTLKFASFKDLCKNTSACFALESVFESVNISQPEACSVLANFVISGTILSRTDNEFKDLSVIAGSKTASHVFSVIIGFCDDPRLLIDLLGVYTVSCSVIFEHDYSKLIQSLFRGLCKANTLISETLKEDNGENVTRNDDQTKNTVDFISPELVASFEKAQRTFIDTIVELTEAGKYFIRALLLPGQPITGPFSLEFSFSTNSKYMFKALATTFTDKSQVTPEFKQQRREEHQRREKLAKEQFFGTKYKKKEAGVITHVGVWQTGKGIVISWFNMGNPDIVNMAAESLIDYSFPDPKDAFKLIMHPAGCDVYQACLGSVYVAPWYKIKLINNLKPVIDKLARNKLGCLVLIALFDATLSDTGDIPVDVIEASRIVLASEIDIRAASASFHGRQLCAYMKLDEFQRSGEDWNKTLQRRVEVRKEIMSIFDDAAEPRRRRKA